MHGWSLDYHAEKWKLRIPMGYPAIELSTSMVFGPSLPVSRVPFPFPHLLIGVAE